MDKSYLEKESVKLISFMEAQGYNPTYVSRIKRNIRLILESEGTCFCQNYTDIFEKVIKPRLKSKDKWTIRRIKTELALIEDFHLNGNYPSGRRKYGSFKKTNRFCLLSESFQSDVIAYKKHLETYGQLKKSTIDKKAGAITTVLYHLQELNIYTVNDITEEHMHSVFFNKESKPTYGGKYLSQIKREFQELSNILPSYQRIVPMIPLGRKIRKNIQVLSHEETKTIDEFILSDDELSKRDKAIILLLRYTGLRSSDIVNLEISQIDWDNECLSLFQTKTDNFLTLPLTVTALNQIYDYLVNERQASQEPFLFLSTRRPYSKMTTSGVKGILIRFFKKVNLRQEPDLEKSSHLFRRTLATRLLEENTPVPIISEILGHSSPGSVYHYLSADFEHLRPLCLSLDFEQQGQEEL